MGKEKQQRAHFKRRLLERYEFAINDGEIDYLVARIKKNDKLIPIEYLQKQTNRLSVFDITYKKINFIGVYDKFRKMLVTALPIICKDVSKIEFYTSEVDDV